MSARIPLLRKTPFVIDPRPLTEASSAHAGALAVSRALRALNVLWVRALVKDGLHDLYWSTRRSRVPSQRAA